MLHANFTALSSTEPELEPELLPTEVLHCENTEFRVCLLLWPWPWPWPDDLHIWPVSPENVPADRKRTFYVKAFESYRITDRHIYRQTPQDILPRRFAGGNNNYIHIIMYSAKRSYKYTPTTVTNYRGYRRSLCLSDKLIAKDVHVCIINLSVTNHSARIPRNIQAVGSLLEHVLCTGTSYLKHAADKLKLTWILN